MISKLDGDTTRSGDAAAAGGGLAAPGGGAPKDVRLPAPEGGVLLDRDVNAARNMLWLGLVWLAGEAHRPEDLRLPPDSTRGGGGSWKKARAR